MDMPSLASMVIYIVLLGAIFYVLSWGLAEIGLPEPFNKITRIVIVVVAVLLLINLLLGLTGNAPFRLTR